MDAYTNEILVTKKKKKFNLPIIITEICIGIEKLVSLYYGTVYEAYTPPLIYNVHKKSNDLFIKASRLLFSMVIFDPLIKYCS